MDNYTQRGAAAMASPDHESASRMSEPAPQPKAEAGWKVDNVSVRQAKNGGFIVSCSKSRQPSGENDRSPTYQSNDYAFSTLDEVGEYLRTEFGASEPGPSQLGNTGPVPVAAAG